MQGASEECQNELAESLWIKSNERTEMWSRCGGAWARPGGWGVSNGRQTQWVPRRVSWGKKRGAKK